MKNLTTYLLETFRIKQSIPNHSKIYYRSNQSKHLFIYIILLLVTTSSPVSAQTTDKLYKQLETTKQDSVKCRIISILMDSEGEEIDQEWITKHTEILIQLSKKNLEKSTTPKEKKLYKNYLGGGYMKKGYIYKYNGDIKKALEYYLLALKLKEETNDKRLIAGLHNNIGIIYRSLGDNETALIYFKKSLKIFKEIGEREGIAYALNSIGSLYIAQKKYKEGIRCHTESIKLCIPIKEHSLEAMNYINIGYAYESQNNTSEALKYYFRSKEIYDSINELHGKCLAHIFIGSVYLTEKKYKEAQKYLETSLQISNELGYPENIRKASLRLYKAYEATGDYKRAFKTYELYNQMNDSINNEELRTETVKQTLKYNYEKKAAADSIKASEEKKVVTAQFKKEQTQRYALYIGLVLVLSFSAFLYNRFRVISRQKKIIEIKEQETQEQNALIFQQKQIIEDRHKEITDSINYAERIQRSFLASNELLDRYLPEYFIFFKPKDVVSGDFYWASELKNGKFALVTADSTGHGVPGAIMSLLNITSIEKAIDFHSEPAEILNHARNTIIDRLKKDGSPDGGKDGMDCSICVYDFKELNVKIAAANNPVWIVRNGEFIEIEPDKMPVGKFHNQEDLFKQNEFQLAKGDLIYTITDGFQDQFGGPLGKKFKTKNLRDLLVSISTLPLLEQVEKLEEAFQNWKGSLEQIDDVCIVGIRV